ncbi:MAG: hypothetical protein GY913_04480 [Proteobacteria bacterium]|nr:hypothetical protein [Pseudomonadota bacterium]MCP4916158.1 hypothetical protein [Pseudomonadota bacterium]
MRKLSLGVLAVGVLVSVATSEAPVESTTVVDTAVANGCDDPYPSLCIDGETLEGDALLPDSMRVLDFDTREEVFAMDCGAYDCCTSDVQTGSYTVEATLGEETLSQDTDVENSNACDHEVTTLTYVFDVAR